MVHGVSSPGHETWTMAIHGPDLLVEPRPAALPTGLARLRSRPWLVFLLAGLGMATAAALVGDERAVQPVLTVLGLEAAAAILAGIRIHRPARPLPCGSGHLHGSHHAVFPERCGDRRLRPDWPGVDDRRWGCRHLRLRELIRGRIPGGDRGRFSTRRSSPPEPASSSGPSASPRTSWPPDRARLVGAAFFYPALVALAIVARMWFLGGAHARPPASSSWSRRHERHRRSRRAAARDRPDGR